MTKNDNGNPLLSSSDTVQPEGDVNLHAYYQ